MKKLILLLTVSVFTLSFANFYIEPNFHESEAGKNKCYNPKKDDTKNFSAILDSYVNSEYDPDEEAEGFGALMYGLSLKQTCVSFENLFVTDFSDLDREYEIEYAKYTRNDEEYRIIFKVPDDGLNLVVGSYTNIRGMIEDGQSGDHTWMVAFACGEKFD